MTDVMTVPHALAECRAKNPATCRYHGNPLGYGLANEADLDAALDDLMQAGEPELVYQPHTTFPSEYLPQAEAIIAKANRRLERAGIAERFTYTTDTHVREVDGVDVEYTVFRWNAPTISLNGWSFVAAHEFTPGGQPTSRYLNEAAIRDTREISQRCEHCGRVRHRQRVYWVQNETGEIKQIGSSCLQAFLGVRPQGLWAVGEDLNLGDEERMAQTQQGSVVYPSDRLIAAALKVADTEGGFVSRAQAMGTRRATVDHLTHDWRGGYRDTLDDEVYAKRAGELLTWARNLPADSDNQYVRNLRAVLTEPTVKMKHLPLAVSVVRAYERDQERTRATAARAAVQVTRQRAFLADRGEKLVGIPVTIRNRREFSNDFGGVTMFVMDTDDGYTLKWNSSKFFDEYQPGDRVRIQTATVKDTTIYNDEFQTVLTRTKFVAEVTERDA